jgi:uncharacterized membrane protein
MAPHRNRTLLSPWWRPVAWVVLASLFVALVNTYLLSRDKSFIAELGSAVVIAVVILAAVVAFNAVLDQRERRRNGRSND